MLKTGCPVTLASSTTKTGRHDIAEILLKVALKHQKSNQIKSQFGKHEYLDEKLYGNHRVLLLAFNIHLRKTIPKSQIG
jgi:hypothetical protein